jgi:hypothetical protein
MGHLAGIITGILYLFFSRPIDMVVSFIENAFLNQQPQYRRYTYARGHAI